MNCIMMKYTAFYRNRSAVSNSSQVVDSASKVGDSKRLLVAEFSKQLLECPLKIEHRI
jgi:hypothetical protein